jgi:hypothetical protein
MEAEGRTDERAEPDRVGCIGVDQFRRAVTVGDPAQPADVDLDQIRERIELFVPDMLGDLVTADDAARVRSWSCRRARSRRCRTTRRRRRTIAPKPRVMKRVMSGSSSTTRMRIN